MIIAFVGIDGSGKTTLLEQFANYLEKNDKKVSVLKALRPDSEFMRNYNVIREKYLLKHAEKKREFNTINSYIMSFDLFQQSEALKELDAPDKVILLDRWAICQQLYSKVWMAENDFSKLAYGMCLEPDITFVIDADMEIIEQRIESRGGANEFENMLCLRRLKKMYINYSKEAHHAILIKNNNKLDDALNEIISIYKKIFLAKG